MRARAYAKVNLVLAVGPRRADGYHDLLSLMQSVDLCDIVELALGAPDEPPVRLKCTHPALPLDHRNLAWRAAVAFAEEFGLAAPVAVTLDKGIPIAAGLAGGSADAAAVLRGLVALHRLAPDPERLTALGVRLGADVPFCLVGGTARVEGIGERVKTLPVSPGFRLVLWKPPVGVSTAQVYAELDERRALPGGRSARGERLGEGAWPGREFAETRLA
ncbi:MAG TPA: 4-(cytidine 5'-diphospho)-2-C-methyl-D-erythritol kinase, partial [Firmicutes bacterium]|nr:4-(cytidine 5'-diphospho)-2-C-methyl-D-erythritol kinase [Bacillota bacterium]